MRRCGTRLHSVSSQRRSHPLLSPCPSDTPSRALAKSGASSCSTPCTRWIACPGGRMVRRRVASSHGRQHPGAHAWGRLGPRWATHTSQGPLLKPPRCFSAGPRPGQSLWPGWSTSLPQAKPCVSSRTNAPGRSLAGSNATPPVLWSHAWVPQGAARGSPAPHSTLQGCACPQRPCSRKGRRLRTRQSVSAPYPGAPRCAWTRALALREAACDRLRVTWTAPPPRLRRTGELPRLSQPFAEDGLRGRHHGSGAAAHRHAALPSSPP
jgi:hypothetical protein